MTSPLSIYAFLRRHRNEGFCDDCIAKATDTDPQHVDIVTGTLALFPAEFTRTEEACPQGCGGAEKPVTTAL